MTKTKTPNKYPVITSKDAREHLAKIKVHHKEMMDKIELHRQRIAEEKLIKEQKEKEKMMEKQGQADKQNTNKQAKVKGDREHELKTKELALKEKALLSND